MEPIPPLEPTDIACTRDRAVCRDGVAGDDTRRMDSGVGAHRGRGALEVWWWRTGPGTGAVYYILRTVIAFSLSWFNPFFAIYALVGYFDAPWLITERWARLGLLATAVTMAGSQSGGLPPSDSMQWTVFGLLFVLNAVISMVMYRIGERDLRRTEERIEPSPNSNV